MKEFAFRIGRESLYLREDKRAPLNSIRLVESKNVKPKKDLGLFPFEPVESLIFVPPINLSYPHPQIFRGRESTLLISATDLYTVDEGTMAITKVNIYDPTDESKLKSIKGSGIWHFVDLGPTYMLFNGTVVVFKMNRRGAFGVSEKVFVNDVQTIQTGCYHKGRVITGGFSPDFWRGDWKAFFFNYLESSDIGFKKYIDFGSNWVMWSTIGGGDILAWLYPEFGMSGLTGAHESQNYILEMLKRNEMGFMPMPWQGTVTKVAPLGNTVIVYGDTAITALIQTSEPIPTYGMKHINYNGIAGRGCVGVSENMHIFIDKHNHLWMITPDLNVKELGYHEFLKTLTNPVISYDDLLQEFIISHSEGSYILTDGGLGSSEQIVTSVIPLSGESKGVADMPTGTRPAVIETDTFDMGVRGIKQIMCVAVAGGGNCNITVAVKARFDRMSSFSTYSTVPVNKEGYAYPLTSGSEFRLVITFSDYQYANIDGYIEVRYKLVDKRGIRGIYANENVT
jgi:hypothetical protein